MQPSSSHRQVRNKVNNMNLMNANVNKLNDKRSKSTQIQSFKVDDTIIKDSKSIANSVNDYFSIVES